MPCFEIGKRTKETTLRFLMNLKRRLSEERHPTFVCGAVTRLIAGGYFSTKAKIIRADGAI